MLRIKGELESSLAAYQKAIEINPEHVRAYTGRGIIFVQQGKLDEAIAEFREAMRFVASKDLGAKEFLAGALAKTGWQLANISDPDDRDLNQALELCQKSVEVSPMSRIAWHRLGWTYYRTGEWQKCIDAIEKAGMLQPNGGDAGEWIVLALAHAQLADDPGLSQPQRTQHRKQARQWYEKADPQISRWWSVRPDHDPMVWDFREEARKLLGIEIGN